MSLYKSKYFGTDGIRGTVGTTPISVDFILKLGWALGSVLSKQQSNSQVVIGKDTRSSGYMLESALEAGLSATGVHIILTGPVPTPAVSFLTQNLKAQAGIVISASHNPFTDNGIKIFDAYGQKLSLAVEEHIEALLDAPIHTNSSAFLGKATRLTSAAGDYINYCKSSIPKTLTLKGLHLVIDAAQGACYKIGPQIFTELGAEVSTIGTDPNGVNINKNCGSTHPEALVLKIKELGADLGIAFDGDGDRVIMVDANGKIIDGDQILFIIATHRHKNNALKGGVVGTLMSNLSIEHALTAKGIPFIRTQVGDRFVNNKLTELGWQLGGESSGHILCKDVSTTGDGIVAALQVLNIIYETEKTLAELSSEINLYPQKLINVQIPSNSTKKIHSQVKQAVSDIENQLATSGRVLLRQSGTEPVIRVMVEGENAAEVTKHAHNLASIVKESFSNLES